MKNWKYINGAEVGNAIPASQINGPSAAEIREIAGRVYKTDMRKDDLARAVSFELAKKYKSFQSNSHVMDMVSEVLSKFKIGNETLHELATSKPRNVGNKSNYRYKDYLITQSDEDGEIIVYKPNGRDIAFRGTKSEAMAKDWIDHHVKTGNTKVINSDREFFKELADDAKEHEDNDKQEVEKLVENRLDWSENLVGKEVWVKSGRYEWKCYVMQDKGDKVYIRHDSDGSQGWVSKGRISGKVNNSKVGNAKDKNGKDLRVGDIVLVWTSSGERAGKVKEVSGDRITVAIRNEGDWSTPGKLADKVSNSKAGNGLTRARNAMAGNWNSERNISPVGAYKEFIANLKNAIELGVAAVTYNIDGSILKTWVEQAKKEGYGSHISGVQGQKVILK